MHSRRALVAVLLVVLALVFGTGHPMPAAAEMPGGKQASAMAMNAVASDASPSGMCDKCLKKDLATHACFAVCVGVEAVLPVTSVVRAQARASLASLVERQFHGAAGPPDPPPPKPGVLA
jgi:hypothetical protein